MRVAARKEQFLRSCSACLTPRWIEFYSVGSSKKIWATAWRVTATQHKEWTFCVLFAQAGGHFSQTFSRRCCSLLWGGEYVGKNNNERKCSQARNTIVMIEAIDNCCVCTSLLVGNSLLVTIPSWCFPPSHKANICLFALHLLDREEKEEVLYWLTLLYQGSMHYGKSSIVKRTALSI